MDVVDEADIVVTDQEGVWRDAEDATRTAVHYGFAVFEGEKPGEEVTRCAVSRRETYDAIPGADAGMACSVEGNEEASVEKQIGLGEVFKAER